MENKDASQKMFKFRSRWRLALYVLRNRMCYSNYLTWMEARLKDSRSQIGVDKMLERLYHGDSTNLSEPSLSSGSGY